MAYLEESTRPWGKYQKLFQDEIIWVKRLEVLPRSRLSLQKHQYRHEKWIIIQGQGMAVVDDREIYVDVGDIVDVPIGSPHRMCNNNDGPLAFVEVAFGKYLSEDDITRIKDDYNRVIVQNNLVTSDR